MVKDMSFELGDDQIKTMTILIGLNTSDFTYGKRISLELNSTVAIQQLRFC